MFGDFDKLLVDRETRAFHKSLVNGELRQAHSHRSFVNTEFRSFS